jgi:tRNA (cmo5U34)-methyltransferase
MINYANLNLADNKKNISFKHANINSVKLKKSDLVVCYYTIQFISPSERQQVINKLFWAVIVAAIGSVIAHFGMM